MSTHYVQERRYTVVVTVVLRSTSVRARAVEESQPGHRSPPFLQLQKFVVEPELTVKPVCTTSWEPNQQTIVNRATRHSPCDVSGGNFSARL